MNNPKGCEGGGCFEDHFACQILLKFTLLFAFYLSCQDVIHIQSRGPLPQIPKYGGPNVYEPMVSVLSVLDLKFLSQSCILFTFLFVISLGHQK